MDDDIDLTDRADESAAGFTPASELRARAARIRRRAAEELDNDPLLSPLAANARARAAALEAQADSMDRRFSQLSR